VLNVADEQVALDGRPSTMFDGPAEPAGRAIGRPSMDARAVSQVLRGSRSSYTMRVF
jgi:hypothetical protein